MSFLDTLADFIRTNYKDSAEQYCIVLPNRRAGLFLRQKLAEDSAGHKQAAFLPSIFSIEKYIYHSSGLAAAGELTLLSLLYKSYRKVLGSKAYEFDRFYSSGRLIINDFSDVDDYLANPSDVFEYLFRVKEIEGWFPDEADTDIQKNYLEFYKALKDIYIDFRQILIDKLLSYRGLASRVLAEEGAKNEFKKVCFAGLNALSPSIEKHIDDLLLESKADILWDYDPMYLNDEQHEAGYFLRKARKRWPKGFDNERTSFFETEKEIDFIGAPYQLSQVQVGLQLLRENMEEGKETLMVLADEEMLTSLLHSMPKSISDEVNISMGISVRDTFCGQLIHDVLSLHLNPLRPSAQGKANFYYFDLRKFLSNPLLPLLMESGDQKYFVRLKMGIMENPRKLLYSDYSEVEEENATQAQKLGMLSKELTLLKPWKDWISMCNELENTCQKIFQATLRDAEMYQEREAAWKLMTSIQSIRNIFSVEEDEAVQQIHPVADFIKRSLISLRVPLKGEPLKGIQILGLLETRAMDYEHVIILGVNEGFLPKSSRSDSFIPFDVRRELTLPLPYDTEAVFAYHFYRLLQRAKTVKLVYNTESDPMWGKEPSRYLAQLEHEILRTYPKLKISKKVLDISYQSKNFKNLPIPDRSYIEKRLEEINEHGFSFTALYDFMVCPYRYALKRIMRIPEAEEDPFEPDTSLFGSVFHSSIEQLFEATMNRDLTEEDLDEIIAKAEAVYEKQIAEYKVPDTNYGTMYLATEVIRDSLLRYLKLFKQSVRKEKISILGIEDDLNGEMELSDGRKINLLGIADRIEKRNGIHSIMDLKTSKNIPDLNWEDEMDFDMKKHRNLVQLLFYSMLYLRKNKDIPEVQAANYIILTKNNSRPHYVSKKKSGVKAVNRENLKEIEDMYLESLEALHSENQNFEPTASKSCEYCPYKNVLCFSYEEK